MTEQSKTHTQQKPEGLEPKRAPGTEEVTAPVPGAALAPPMLAAGGDTADQHARLLRDRRVPAVQRQQVATWLGRTRGNRYLQRIIDPAGQSDRPRTRRTAAIQRGGETPAGPAAPGETAAPATEAPAAGPAAEGTATAPGNAPPSLEQRLRDAFASANPPGGVQSALHNSAVDERRGILGNAALMGELRSRLGQYGAVIAARLLAEGMTTAERLQVVAALADVSAAPAGKIRDATGLLLLSWEIVDRNTAQRILNRDMAVYYIEDLSQPPNVNNLVTGYGRDPTLWTLYYRPGSTTQTIWVQLNAEGFRIVGSNIICGFRRLSLDRWQTLLVHETNHARNPDPTTPLLNYQGEFRAYWVAEFRSVADLDVRAAQIKAHVLAGYPEISAAYNADATVKAAIDAYTRPTGNITNL